MRTLSSFTAALVGAFPLVGQTASVSAYGTGCAFAGQSLAIGAIGLPQLGTTCSVTYSGPNVTGPLTIQPLLGLGLVATSVPIPPSILPQQPANCSQWIVPDVLLATAGNPLGGFDDTVPIPVPNAAGLIGFQFVAQWVATVLQCGIVAPCTLDALPTSDALLLTVGV